VTYGAENIGSHITKELMREATKRVEEDLIEV
jgi:hypothetical protein